MIAKLEGKFGESNNKEYQRLIVELISLKILRSVDEEGWSNFLVDELGFYILNNFSGYSDYVDFKKSKETKELSLLHNNAIIAKRTRTFMYISLMIGFIGGISGLIDISSKFIPSKPSTRTTSSQISPINLDSADTKIDSLKFENTEGNK